MSYQEDDAKYPAQADKVRRAKKQFIEKGALDLVGLAMMLGLDPQYLKQRSADENWSEIRFQDLMTKPSEAVAEFERTLALESDPMRRHSMVSDFLVDMAFTMAKTLSSGSLRPEDMTFLRSKIESLRSLAEATVASIEIARKVRGIEEGTPSSGRLTEDTHVKYTVSVSPEAKTA